MQGLAYLKCWRAGLVFGILAAFLSLPQDSLAWGRNAHRLIINKAVDTLPADLRDLRAFFEFNRNILAQHVTDPLDGLAKNPAEKRSEEHTSELQSLTNLVCRLLLEKK